MLSLGVLFLVPHEEVMVNLSEETVGGDFLVKSYEGQVAVVEGMGSFMKGKLF